MSFSVMAGNRPAEGRAFFRTPCARPSTWFGLPATLMIAGRTSRREFISKALNSLMFSVGSGHAAAGLRLSGYLFGLF
jgi:hypothetical protein